MTKYLSSYESKDDTDEHHNCDSGVGDEQKRDDEDTDHGHG